MKFIRRLILYLMLTVIHFLLQSTMMLVSVASQLVFYEESVWSVGGMLALISGTLYKVLAFPFIWIFDHYSIVIFRFHDLPYFLNSLLWAGLGYYVITRRRSKNIRSSSTRYQFIRG